MAKAKKAIKKKAAPKKKAVVKKKVAAQKKEVGTIKPVNKKAAVTRSMEMSREMSGAAAPAPPVAAEIIDLPNDELIIELCGPGKRCKQRNNGSFIRQNFISGRWVQVGGTVFPTLEACKIACGG